MKSHVMEYWSAILGGSRGYLSLMAQGENVVDNMAKHDNPNTHKDLKNKKTKEYLQTDFTSKIVLVTEILQVKFYS